MTKKVLKILFIVLILFSFCISHIYATDIDFNLQNNEANTSEDPNNTEIPGNEVDENSIIDGNAEIPEEPIDSSTTGETLNPAGISTAPESGLSVTNIINILLITVGVIIILLAIAIIIRLKN